MRKALILLLGLACVAGCDGGGKGDKGGGDFRLIQFLENNQSGIARNHSVTFLFSGPVRPAQDFAQRLKIQNVQQAPGSDFTLAIGTYVVSGDRVTFSPRLPNLDDRSDAGYRADANYVVFLKGGPDSLESLSGDRIARPQEFNFLTSQFFEDIIPQQPPRALGFVARDKTTNVTTDVGRLDPRPAEVALDDSATLIANARYIDPGAGGPPSFGTPWQFELIISEPIDPSTVNRDLVQMFEIFSDATTSAEDATPDAPQGHMGNAEQFRVPLLVRVEQKIDPQGNPDVRIIATPIYTLVDDTRYRITFSGAILGLDFRKEYTGENGLTGDGQTILAGSAPYAEPGGLGYTTEFLVADRMAITQKRRLTYDPLVDGIQPELGQTVLDEDRYNSSLYNPAINPGTAVGFLSAFGQGTDGNLAVANGTTTIDTGDTPNPAIDTFTVFDLNPNNNYHGNPLPGGQLTYDNPEPFDLQLETLTVSSGATLQFIGVNPPILRVRGIAQVSGRIDVAGRDGTPGGGSLAPGGAGGAAGFAGGTSRRPAGVCIGYCPGGANDFQVYLNACPAAATNQPHAFNGGGPGRGYAGGTGYTYDYSDDLTQGGGTGGGGASHATKGSTGEDVKNVGQGAGTAGNPCDFCGVRPDGVIGVRGESGPIYGDRELAVILLGGSGGGGGGSMANWNTPKTQAGGSGGGGGGSITIVAAGPILLSGGTIDASGGDGGKGAIVVQSQPNGWQSTSGGGGGGAGGSISLISGDSINVTNGILDARGGAGGPRSDVGTTFNCNACNAGGAGGRGFIFLMDSDGQIAGLLPGTPGNYDSYGTGVLTISQFDASRFSSIAAVTELFPALAANPVYLDPAQLDILALVNVKQQIHVFASSAKADADDPLVPDITTETMAVEVATVEHANGGTSVDVHPGMMAMLNPSGIPARDAFVRIDARFDYEIGVQAALGPFAYIDQVDLTIRFNG